MKECDGRFRKVPEGPSCVAGWDVVYRKPRDNAEVIRRSGVVPPEYGLACTLHREYRSVGRSMVDERPLRRGPRGEWCPGCAKDHQAADADLLTPDGEQDRRPIPTSTYRHLCEAVKIAEREGAERVVERTVRDVHRDQRAVRAVLERSAGTCENPDCGGMPDDVTEAGDPILEVDHVKDLALGGRDHPKNMIALCPNCHAMKTRGSRQSKLRKRFRKVAKRAHQAALAGR